MADRAKAAKAKRKDGDQQSETERGMAATIKAITTEAVALRAEVTALRVENARLKDEVLQLQGLPVTCDLLQVELRAAIGQHGALAAAHEQAQAEWAAERARLEESVAALTATNRLVAAQTAQRAEDFAVLRQQLVEKDTLIIALQSRGPLGDEQGDLLSLEVRELRRKLQKEEGRSQQLETVQEECNQLLTRIGKLQQQNWAFEQRQQDLEAQVAQLQQDNEKLLKFWNQSGKRPDAELGSPAAPPRQASGLASLWSKVGTSAHAQQVNDVVQKIVEDANTQNLRLQAELATVTGELARARAERQVLEDRLRAFGAH